MLSSINRDRGYQFVVFQAPIETAAIDQAFFISPGHFEVEEIRAVWGTAASGAAKLTVEKNTGTTAVAGGTALHSTAIDLDGAAATVNKPTLTATKANRRLKPGDRLEVDFSGAATTGLVGLCVTVWLRPISKYQG